MFSILLTLSACETEKTDTPDKASERAAARAEAAASVRSKSVTTDDSETDEDWYILSAAVQSVDGGDASIGINLVLEERAMRKAVGQRVLAQRLSELQGQLAMGCESPEIDEAMAAFIANEAEAMAADREDLHQILEIAGPQGREILWDLASPEEVFHADRKEVLSKTSKNLPSWVAADTDPDRELQARRTLLALRFTLEGIALASEARVTDFESKIKTIDPVSDSAPDDVRAAMESLDAMLLTNQNERADRLLEACARMADEYWLSILAKGEVERFLGTYGADEMAEPTKSSSSSSSDASMARMSRSGTTSGQAGASKGPSNGTTASSSGGMGQGGSSGMGQGGSSGMGQGGSSGMGQGGSSGMGQGGSSGMGQGGSQGGMGQTGGGSQGGMGQTGGGQTGGGQTGGGQTGGGQTGGGSQGGMGQTGGGQTGGMGQTGGGSQGGMGQTGGGQTGGGQTGGGQQGGGGQTGGMGQTGGGSGSGGQQGGQQGGGR